MPRRYSTISLILLGGCTVSNPPPPAYYPPPPPPPQQVAPAPTPAPTPAPPAPTPTPAAQPAPPAPAIDANAPCIDGAGDVANEFDGALPVTVPSTVVVCAGVKDVDVFTITAPGTTGASLITYDIKQLTDDKQGARLTIFDSNRKKDQDHIGRRSEHIRGWAVLQGGTQMFLKVAQVHREEGKFALTLNATPIADPNEPNDTREQAKPLTGTGSGISYGALNNKEAPSDWYTVEVAKAGPVNVAVDAAEKIAIKATAFDSNKKRLGIKNGGRGERIEWSFKAKAPGTYQLEIKSVHRIPATGRDDAPSHLTRPYTVTVSQP